MINRITAAEAATFLNMTVQAVHKRLRKDDLPFSKSMNRIYFGHETARELFKLKVKNQTIAFQIVKGGTGKTSLAHTLALRANLYGLNILCIDLDQQANLTHAFGITPLEMPIMLDVINEGMNIQEAIIKVSDGLFLLPSRIENAVLDNLLMLNKHPLHRVYKDSLDSIKNDYDIIIIDCPPALGQSTAAAALSSDIVIAPVTPEEFSISGLKLSFTEIKKLEKQYSSNISLRVVINKFDSRNSLSHKVLSSLMQHEVFNEILYKTFIRTSQEFANSVANHTSLFNSLRPTSAKEDIDFFTREVLELKPENSEHSFKSLTRQ